MVQNLRAYSTSCYHNQMDNVCAGRDRTFQYATKSRVELNQDFMKSLLSYKDKATTKITYKKS